MDPDFDDTVRRAPRLPAVGHGVDLDDTLRVERGATRSPAVALADGGPPALVEPPIPSAAAPASVAPMVPTIPAIPVVAPRAPFAPPPPFESADVRRPYRVTFTAAPTVDLDTTIYVGRRPSVPRIHSGAPPRLVVVPSPAKEVSATHLELRVVGGTIVVSDMLSTNGTIVTVPGSPSRTLIRGESAVVTPGTLIDLGDGNVLEVLSPPRVTADAGLAS